MRFIIGFGLLSGLLIGGFMLYSKFGSGGGAGVRPPNGGGKVTPPAVTGPKKGYVAQVDIPARGVITPGIVGEMETDKPGGWPDKIVRTEKELEGFVVRDEVRAGQPILSTNSLRGRIKPSVLAQVQSSGRMLVISNVEIRQKASSSVALLTGTRLRAKIGLESATAPAAARPAGDTGAKPGNSADALDAAKAPKAKAKGKTKSATTSSARSEPDHSITSAPQTGQQVPIFVTILFASSPNFDGPQLWDSRPPEEEGSTGRDLLISASPADAMEVGRAARDHVLGFEPAEAVNAVVVTSGLKPPESKGLRLIDVNDVLRTEIEEQKRKEVEEERKKQAEERRLREDEERKRRQAIWAAQMALRNRHSCNVGNPQCGRFAARVEPIEREIDVYKGRELTKVKMTEGSRTVQDWTWYPGHGAGNASSVAPFTPLPPASLSQSALRPNRRLAAASR